jgi:hypothetical protein
MDLPRFNLKKEPAYIRPLRPKTGVDFKKMLIEPFGIPFSRYSIRLIFRHHGPPACARAAIARIFRPVYSYKS